MLSNGATGNDNVEALVYVGAFDPDTGESAVDLSGRFEGSALGEPSGDPAWKSVPSWFLFGSDDRNIPAASHRFMAERAGSRRTIELAGGSHTVAIPEARQVADLIMEAIEATRGGERQ